MSRRTEREIMVTYGERERDIDRDGRRRNRLTTETMEREIRDDEQ